MYILYPRTVDRVEPTLKCRSPRVSKGVALKLDVTPLLMRGLLQLIKKTGPRPSFQRKRLEEILSDFRRVFRCVLRTVQVALLAAFPHLLSTLFHLLTHFLTTGFELCLLFSRQNCKNLFMNGLRLLTGFLTDRLEPCLLV